MILIACVDDNLGMLFNNRRQSMDRVLRARLLKLCGTHKLWMNAYSRGQFDETAEGITVDEDFMAKAGSDDYCLPKTSALSLMKKKCRKLFCTGGTGFIRQIYILTLI